nr:DUF2490 domain-containing protein [Microscilla sp. PRE1]
MSYSAVGELLHVACSTKKIEPSDQQWFQYYLKYDLSAKWSFLGDTGYRWQKELAVPSQYLVRAASGYDLLPNVRLVVGFAHLDFYEASSYEANSVERLEYRPYQELQMSQDFGKVKASQRFRLEERAFRFVNSDQKKFNFRFRYRVLFRIPLHQFEPGCSIFLISGDELLINVGR